MMAHKIGLHKNRPANEARPLGTKAPKRGKKVAKKSHVDTTPAPVVESPVTHEPPTTAMTPVVENTNQEQSHMASPLTGFTYVRTSKFGQVIYRREGVRGTVSFSKSMVSGEPPVNAEDIVLAEPSQTVTSDPAKLEKLQKAAEKAQARLVKTQERLAKINAKLGKAAEAETVGA